MSISRRCFLKYGTVLASAWVPPFDLWLPVSNQSRSTGKALVVIELAGGNDGLNTVVPHRIRQYYRARPTLAVRPEATLPLDGELGLNPVLAGFARLYRSGKLAIIQGVGYPHQSRSHVRSMQIWRTASPDEILPTGWLERYLHLATPGEFNPEAPSILHLRASPPAALAHLVPTAPQAPPGGKTEPPVPYSPLYPSGTFDASLSLVAQMIHNRLSSNIYTVTLDGFDTHSRQSESHPKLLRQLSDGLFAFISELEQRGRDNDVLILVFSEFGRRLAENEEGGCNHGSAGPLFVMGSRVKGGIYGHHPDLTGLDNGDLRFEIDFRSVYATILDRWLGADSQQILYGNFGHIDFLR